jgi:hypothetical protein
MENSTLPNTTESDESGVGIALPLTLRTGHGPLVAGIAIFALLSGVSLWLYLDGEGWPALACALLFAALAALSAIGVRYPATLQIDETGFTLTSPLRKDKAVTTAWNHVEQFGVVSVGRSYVSYQINAASGRRRIPGGYMLPAFNGMPAPLLAAMMEACREQFSAP